MSETAQSVLTAAMSLSEAERSTLVDKLLETLPPPDGWEEVSKQEFFAEIMRRHEEAQRDSTVSVSADEAHAKLEKLMREVHAEAQG